MGGCNQYWTLYAHLIRKWLGSAKSHSWYNDMDPDAGFLLQKSHINLQPYCSQKSALFHSSCLTNVFDAFSLDFKREPLWEICSICLHWNHAAKRDTENLKVLVGKIVMFGVTVPYLR